MKKQIKLTETQLRQVVKESICKILKENYDMEEFIKTMKKSNNTYNVTSSDKLLQTGDNVIVHTKKGDIKGVIDDFDISFTTFEETADVKFIDENGKEKLILGCPLSKIEKI